MGFVIAVFFSFGAIIGAMITMYASVAHRQREIGTLRALGFPRAASCSPSCSSPCCSPSWVARVGVVAALGMRFMKFSTMNFATWSEIVFTFEPTPDDHRRACPSPG